MNELIFSIYEGDIKHGVPSSKTTLTEVYNRITTDTVLKERTEALRALPMESQEQKNAKSLLPFITPSGTFTYRSNKDIVKYSGLICIDVDHLKAEERKELKEKVLKDEDLNVLLLFVSPRGEGLKIILPTDEDSTHHKQWFEYYSKLFRDKYKVEIDQSCKDVCRACFLSYDEDAYLGNFLGFKELPQEESAETVGVVTTTRVASALTVEEQRQNAQKLLYRLWDVRRNSLHVCDTYDPYFQFVSACAASTGEFGRDSCREICQRSLKFEAEHFEKLYSEQMNNPKNTFTFGTVQHLVEVAGGGNSQNSQNSQRHMQLFTESWTWDNRPQWIPKGENRNIEICYIMGFLTTASAIMPHVFFYHDNQKYYLNLYTVIQGETASGKSKVTQMTRSIDSIDQWVKNNSGKDLPYCIKETGNITDAMLIYDMAYNQDNINKGSMLIHVAEVDVMSQKKKIGLSSENTRLAWGHEAISAKRKGMDTQSRKEDRKGYYIPEPRVSILMTGTPSQMPNYFTNATDGNLSRYLIYTLDENKEYRSGLYPPTEAVSMDYSKLCECWGKQMELAIETQLSYTNEQKQELDEIFSSLKQFYASQNDKFHNYINRLPIAVRRLAGVIATVESWNRGELTGETLQPTDEQWHLAIQLVLNSLNPLYRLYSHPAISHTDEVRRQVWVDMLGRVSQKFSRDAFVNIALEEGYSEKSANNAITYLRNNNYIKRIHHGEYEKVVQQ